MRNGVYIVEMAPHGHSHGPDPQIPGIQENLLPTQRQKKKKKKG